LGRPTKFTKALAERVCDLIASTPRGLDFICERDPDLPSSRTISRWLSSRPAFCQSYAHARELQAWLLFDECLEISDDGTNDTTLETRDGRQVEIIHPEVVARSKLRVETRLKMAVQLYPKKFGPKVELGGQVAVAVVLDKPQSEDEWSTKHAPG
jgi:hypothetical protein